MIGPNCPGIITPEESLAGITPHTIAGKGPIGLVSKSGTLTYQMMYELKDFGFSTAIGIGGDPIVGTTHIDALAAFEADPDTKAIVMIGEIGGDAEERAAAYIKDNVTKPVVGYVAGFTAPEGKTMGHAGAIVSGSSGTAAAKKEALEAVGVKVGKTPSETAALMREILQGALTSATASRQSAVAQLPEPLLGAVRQGDERVGADAHVVGGHEGQLRDRVALADDGHQEAHGAVLGHLDGQPPHGEVAGGRSPPRRASRRRCRGRRRGTSRACRGCRRRRPAPACGGSAPTVSERPNSGGSWVAAGITKVRVQALVKSGPVKSVSSQRVAATFSLALRRLGADPRLVDRRAPAAGRPRPAARGACRPGPAGVLQPRASPRRCRRRAGCRGR